MTEVDNVSKLAVCGGTPVRATPFPPRASIGLEEKAAVGAVFDRAIASGIAPRYDGDEEQAYCREFAALMGGGYVDAVSSGTAGMYVALKALQLEPFSEVIVGAMTDPGGMMPIPLLNLIPMVADTAPDRFNTGPDQVETLISPRTSAIVVQHMGGEPADITGIVAIGRESGIPVIEDCAQAHGAGLNGRLVGTFGDIAVFSTMSSKHHSSGGQGGLVYTRDEELYETIRRASDRGKPFFLPPGSSNTVASLNFNLNDLAAAIGRVQLENLPHLVSRRRAIVARIVNGIRDLETVSVPTPIDGAEPSYWFLRMRFHAEKASCDKAAICQALDAEGLPVRADYTTALPHVMDWFVNRRVFGNSGYPWASPDYTGNPNLQFPCPNAKASIRDHFNIGFHENRRDGDVADAIAILEKVGSAYQRSA